MPSKGLELWGKVCDTPKEFVKKMPHKPLHAVDAQWQKQQATTIWGPYGALWGLKDLKWDMIWVQEQPTELVLTAKFFSPEGEFELSTSCGWKKNNDCHKKTQTDLLTKSLSYLGFASDVFYGAFEDNKYMSEGGSGAVEKGVYLGQDTKKESLPTKSQPVASKKPIRKPKRKAVSPKSTLAKWTAEIADTDDLESLSMRAGKAWMSNEIADRENEIIQCRILIADKNFSGAADKIDSAVKQRGLKDKDAQMLIAELNAARTEGQADELFGDEWEIREDNECQRV